MEEGNVGLFYLDSGVHPCLSKNNIYPAKSNRVTVKIPLICFRGSQANYCIPAAIPITNNRIVVCAGISFFLKVSL